MPKLKRQIILFYISILLVAATATGCANRNQTLTPSLPSISVEEQLSVADAQLRSGKNNAAYKGYSIIISSAPQTHEAFYGRGLAALHLGKTEQAIFDFSRACEIDSGNITYLREKGIALVKIGKTEAALEVLNTVLDLNPEDDNALLSRGLAYAALENQELAIEDFTAVIKSSTLLRASAYYNRARAFESTNVEQALADYTESHKLAPNDSKPLNNRGLLLLTLGRYKEAHIELDKAIALKKTASQLYFNRAIIRENLGEYERALQDYDKTLALNSRHIEALYNRGILHQRIGNKEQACTDLKQAADLGLPDRYERSAKMGLCE